jgi:HEAT repeat protein
MDLFSKEGRAKGALARNIARVSNKYAQSPDRFAAMEKLREDGSEEALYGLCKRFSFKYDKGIEDEQEKEWAVEALISRGESAIPAVRRYAKEADTLSWALKILEGITHGDAGAKKMLEIVDEVLASDPPGYTRDPSRKLEMIGFLSEWHGAPAKEVAPRIVPYLKDFDQNVRFAAADALAHQPDEASSRSALLDAMLRPEEELRRIKVRTAEVLADQGWTVTDRKEAVAAMIASDLTQFGMHHDKLVRSGKGK